jgi:hypothetical protein
MKSNENKMKKQLLFIAVAGLFSSLASAADFYVREGGAGGAYSTISAAISASTNGDRIIIQPKAGGGAYVENLAINKSLTFVSETNFAKYVVTGNVTITPTAGRLVTISNLSLTPAGNIYTNYAVTINVGSIGGRTTLNLLNSVLNSVNSAGANSSIYMSGCTATGVMVTHGRFTANKFGSLTFYATNADTNPSADDIEAFANAIIGGIVNQQGNYNFKFNNNFVSGLYVYTIKTGGSNEMINNTVYSPNGGDIAPIYVSVPTGNTGSIAIMNNAVSFVVGQTNACIQNNSIATVTASYNLFTNTYVTEGSITQSNNTGAVNMTFNDVTYTVTGMNVNAGNPAVSYTDLDLTRNDAGHNGGSNSWANYWPTNVGNKAQVNYLLTPRIITPVH